MATKKIAAPKKAAKPKQKKEAAPVIVRGFKGFTKDLTCTGGPEPMQYEIGKTYEEPEAHLCHKGLHFCEHPLDCLGYYSPGAGSRYCEVTAESPTDERENDSKRVTKKLTIGGELSISGLVDAAVKFVFERATWSDSEKSTGFKGAASATGFKGAASATGDWGAASATGREGVAMACGCQGKAKGCIGSWIVLAERNDDGEILTMRCAEIDGEVLKENTFYTLRNGEFVEV